MGSVCLLLVREGFQQVSFKNQLERAQAGTMLLCRELTQQIFVVWMLGRVEYIGAVC